MLGLFDFLDRMEKDDGIPYCPDCGKEMRYDDGWYICDDCNIGYEVDTDD